MSLDAARERLEDLIRELAPDLGPVRSEDAVDIHDDEERNGYEPVAGAVLTGWVLTAAWVDPEDVEPFVVRLSSKTLASYERCGLLFEALFRMES